MLVVYAITKPPVTNDIYFIVFITMQFKIKVLSFLGSVCHRDICYGSQHASQNSPVYECKKI